MMIKRAGMSKRSHNEAARHAFALNAEVDIRLSAKQLQRLLEVSGEELLVSRSALRSRPFAVRRQR